MTLEATPTPTFLISLLILDALDRSRGDREWSTTMRIAASINRRWLLDDEPQWTGAAMNRILGLMEEYGWVKSTKQPKNAYSSMNTTLVMKSGPLAYWILPAGYDRLKVLRESMTS